MGVSSALTLYVVGEALARGYDEASMQMLRQAFNSQKMQGDMNQVAQRLGSAIRQGVNARDLGSRASGTGNGWGSGNGQRGGLWSRGRRTGWRTLKIEPAFRNSELSGPRVTTSNQIISGQMSLACMRSLLPFFSISPLAFFDVAPIYKVIIPTHFSMRYPFLGLS